MLNLRLSNFVQSVHILCEILGGIMELKFGYKILSSCGLKIMC